MDWITLLCFSIPIGALTAAVCVLHARVSLQEDRLINLTAAGIHLANGLKMVSETQGKLIESLLKQVKPNESTTT